MISFDSWEQKQMDDHERQFIPIIDKLEKGADKIYKEGKKNSKVEDKR
jgi:hypothetical protein